MGNFNPRSERWYESKRKFWEKVKSGELENPNAGKGKHLIEYWNRVGRPVKHYPHDRRGTKEYSEKRSAATKAYWEKVRNGELPEPKYNYEAIEKSKRERMENKVWKDLLGMII